jgi:hypothetical protein
MRSVIVRRSSGVCANVNNAVASPRTTTLKNLNGALRHRSSSLRHTAAPCGSSHTKCSRE